MVKVPPYVLSMEERLNLLSERDARRLVAYFKALKDKYGSEALETIAKANRELNSQRCKRVMEKLNILERDAVAAVKLLTYFHTIGGNKGEVVEATPKRAVRIERACPYQNIYTYELCRVLSISSMEGICDAVNPKLVTSHPRFLTRGDDVCEIVFELRG